MILLLSAALGADYEPHVLVYAAEACDSGGVRASLAAGASPDGEAWSPLPYTHQPLAESPENGWTTGVQQAVICALRGQPDALAVLLNAGATVDMATKDVPPALHLALDAVVAGEEHGASVARALLHRGARPLATYRGVSALDSIYDATGPRTEAEATAESVLLAAGVSEGELLCAAARRGDLQAVSASVAPVDGSCREGSPLMAAASAGQVGAIAELVRKGARVDGGARRLVEGGWSSPMHLAASSGQGDVVAALAAEGMSPDLLAGPAWATAVVPLQVAMASESHEAVQALVEAGADRAVWLAPEEREGSWRSLFDPALGVAREDLSRHEAAAAYVYDRMLDVERGEDPGGWEGALQDWSPLALSLLWAQADRSPGALPSLHVMECGDVRNVRELRGAWGRPDREGGRWAQRWTWAESEAVVTRERWPGRWTVLEHTALADPACQALMGHPAADAMLQLGPPDRTNGREMRWYGYPEMLVVRMDEEGQVVSVSLHAR